jgi:predicted N-acetyltransferase YhbS
VSVGYSIEPLDLARHDRKRFDCGEPALNEYLRRFAEQHARSNLSRSFVAAQENRVLGYYSLAAGSIQRSNLPAELQGRYPNFPLPVVRLARLAVSLDAQGRGIGQDLLVDSLLRTRRMAQEAGRLILGFEGMVPAATGCRGAPPAKPGRAA